MHSNSENVQQRIDEMLKNFKKHNFRITPQRLAVFKILAASEVHPSVEKIYEQVSREFPTISIATVYKTIQLLKQINDVIELDFPDCSNRYNGKKPYPHPHVICIRFPKILDPDLGSLKNITEEVSNKAGFKIQTHRLDFFGLCAKCKKAEKCVQNSPEQNRK